MCPHIRRFLPLSDTHFDLFPSEVSGDKIEKNEMGGACRAYGWEAMRMQGFGGETYGKEAS
jgi:hypothetical protein